MRKFRRFVAPAEASPCYNGAMLPISPKCSRLRFSRQVSLWLPAILLLPILLLSALACGLSTPPPPTLQFQPPTATSTEIIPETATPAIPTGATDNLPIDPGITDMLNAVQSDRLMVTVGTLADMHTRHVLSKTTNLTPGIGAARDWLMAQFNDLRDKNPQHTINVWQQDVKYLWNGFNVDSQNVVATFQGTDIGAGVILVGAHYDSISADFSNGQAYAPGANDDASGIAAMLEIARLLAPQAHRATILFVAFTGEETGKQGSQAFITQYLQAQDPPIDLRAMLNLDTIGSEMGPNGDTDSRTLRLFSAEPNDSPSRQLARQLALVIKTYLDSVDPVIQSAEERAGRWGDQQSFRAAGYPAVRFIQGLEDLSRQQTSRDTVDNVQAGYLVRSTQAILACVAVLADGPRPPTDFVLRPVLNDTANQLLIWTPVQDAAEYLVILRQSTSLSYDKMFTVKAVAAPELEWGGFERFTTVAIASIDGAGRMGPLSPEAPITSLVRS
jgi:Peptidase family M28